MKKVFLSLFCALGMSGAMAQDESTTYVPDFSDTANDYLYGATAYGVSANGEWVAGYGDEFTMSSFVWNRTTGEFARISGAPYQKNDRDRSECYAVSNEGIVVGGVETSKGYLSPGYWKDGVWTVLDGGEGEVAMATAISPNSRIIVGQILREVEKTYYIYDYDKGEYDYSNPQKKTAKVYVPVHWLDGVLQEAEGLPAWYPAADNVGTGIYCFHASDDGNSLALNYEHPSGSKAPAALIDGKIKFFYGENDIDVNTDTYFFFGETTNVSRNGKFFCGYFALDGANAQGFVYDVDKDELTEVDGLPSVITNDGTYYTASAANGMGVMGISADRSVMCGYKSEYSDLGLVPYPVVYVYQGEKEDPNATFVPTSTTPAENSEVDELKIIYINCEEAVDYNADNKPYLLDAEGNEVTKGKMGYGPDDNTIMVTLNQTITKQGTYTLVIPANSIGDRTWADGFNQPGTGAYNAELHYSYVVNGRYGLEPESIDPEVGSTLAIEGGNQFRLTFDTAVKVDASLHPALKLSVYGSGLEGTLAVDDNNDHVVIISIEDTLSPNKTYTLYIPAGAISTADDQSINPELTYGYKTDAVEAVYDISFDFLTPENGRIAEGESLQEILLNASMDWYDKKGQATDVKFYKHGTNDEVTTLKKLTYTTADYRQVKVVLSEAVTATGAYDLYFPAGVLGDQNFIMGTGGHANMEQILTFYIGNTDGINALYNDNQGALNVYDLNGRLVLPNATPEDLQSLDRGIYTVGASKYLVY